MVKSFMYVNHDNSKQHFHDYTENDQKYDKLTFN